MSTTTLPTGIVARAKAILTAPAATWPAIAAEPDSVAGLYTGYIAILAAITPLATFIHGVVFGYGAMGFSYHPSFFSALSTAIVTYLFTLAGTFVMAVIIAALAPTFQGQNNQLQALKLVAYAATASWLAGIFNLLPGLGILALLGLYSLYLFYIGLPVLMQSPPEKSLPYTLVIFVAAIVVGVVVSFTASFLTGGAPYGRMADGSISFPSRIWR